MRPHEIASLMRAVNREWSGDTAQRVQVALAQLKAIKEGRYADTRPRPFDPDQYRAGRRYTEC